MSDQIKRLPIAEFRDLGFLQEANRQFFHPHGLALEVVVDHETGEQRLGGIWDYRDDPEGVLYGNLSMKDAKRAGAVLDERRAHAVTRARLFGQEGAVLPGPDIEPLGYVYPGDGDESA